MLHGTDFFKGFGFPVPLEIIATRLGIPEADRDFFYEGATEAASTLRMSPITPERTLHRAQVAAGVGAGPAPARNRNFEHRSQVTG